MECFPVGMFIEISEGLEGSKSSGCKTKVYGDALMNYFID